MVLNLDHKVKIADDKVYKLGKKQSNSRPVKVSDVKLENVKLGTNLEVCGKETNFLHNKRYKKL